MNAKNITTQLIRRRPTYLAVLILNALRAFFHSISPPEIIPYYKNKNILCLCDNYISETQTFSDSA